MPHKTSFAIALRTLRKAKGLSQEAFSDVTGRTYLSALERGLQVPTLGKVDALADVMGVHPLTLLVLAYAGDEKSVSKLIGRVQEEIAAVWDAES